MSKRGLPLGVKMRHDAHYVEEFARTTRSVGRVIPINQIAPNPKQPRVEIGDLTELSGSIKQNGVLEPLLVKPNGNGTWMIIAGERRWRAANLAGLSEVPCIELDIDEKSIAEIALIENLQRKDLTIWEEADGFAYLTERFGYTHEEIAKKIGKSRSTVTESMAIAGLPESIRAKCRQSKIITKSTLLEIARQFDEKGMHDFLENIGTKSFKRKAVNPSSKSTPDNDPLNQGVSLIQENKENNFIYKSHENDFTLQISFNSGKSFDSKNVLEALREVFIETKKSL